MTTEYRGLQGVTGDYRGLKEVRRSYGGLQGVTRGYGGLKGVTTVLKKARGHLRVSGVLLNEPRKKKDCS